MSEARRHPVRPLTRRLTSTARDLREVGATVREKYEAVVGLHVFDGPIGGVDGYHL